MHTQGTENNKIFTKNHCAPQYTMSLRYRVPKVMKPELPESTANTAFYNLAFLSLNTFKEQYLMQNTDIPLETNYSKSKHLLRK